LHPEVQQVTAGFINSFYVRKRDDEDAELNDLIDRSFHETAADVLLEPEEQDAQNDGESDHQNEIQISSRNVFLQEHEVYTGDDRPIITQLEQTLLMLSSKTGIDPNLIQPAIDYFRRFLTSDYRECDLSPIDSKRFNWIALHAQGQEKYYIADLAMRIEPTSCAEASCERLISAQRMILTSKRMRSKPELINARLALQTLIR
jgi:hypothetical protein